MQFKIHKLEDSKYYRIQTDPMNVKPNLFIILVYISFYYNNKVKKNIHYYSIIIN